MQDEKQRKQFIQKTFDTVAQDYGLGLPFTHMPSLDMAH
jgi:hypothetical protein